MSDLFMHSRAQMRPIEPFFPRAATLCRAGPRTNSRRRLIVWPGTVAPWPTRGPAMADEA